jgi:hypothetical protein
MRKLLGSMLVVAVLALLPSAARAQQEQAAPAPEQSEGEPLYGYIGTGFFAAFAIFTVCKSSRR